MVLFGLENLDIWEKTAPLSAFTSTLGSAFAANLFYSIVARLGRFSGRRIDIWISGQRVRVFSALAENPKFDGPAFTERGSRVRKRWRRLIWIARFLTLTWAIAASLIAIVALWLVPFYPTVQISGGNAAAIIAALYGAVPVGIVGWLLFHGGALCEMWYMGREWSGAIKLLKTETDTALNSANEVLRRRDPHTGKFLPNDR